MKYIALMLFALVCTPAFAGAQTGEFGKEFYVLEGETLVVKNQVPLKNDSERWFKAEDTCATMRGGTIRVLFRFGDDALAEYFFNESPTVNQSCPSRVITTTTMTRLRALNAEYAKWQEKEFLQSLVGQKDYREEGGSFK